MKAIFARKEAGVLDQIFTVGDALAVISVTERKMTSDDAFEKQKAELTLQAVKGKQFEVREAFIKSLKQSGTVVTNEKAVDKVVGSDS
jgi:peptidyl-prolyl cis-trans isomerase D